MKVKNSSLINDCIYYLPPLLKMSPKYFSRKSDYVEFFGINQGIILIAEEFFVCFIISFLLISSFSIISHQAVSYPIINLQQYFPKSESLLMFLVFDFFVIIFVVFVIEERFWLRIRQLRWKRNGTKREGSERMRLR